MSRKPLKRNFFINPLAPLARIAVALVTIPIYVRHVGDARYGVISIMWILLGYFGFLDLGLSRAATNALAKLREASQPERARVLLTTFALNLGFGLVGSAILFILGGFAPSARASCQEKGFERPERPAGYLYRRTIRKFSPRLSFTIG